VLYYDNLYIDIHIESYMGVDIVLRTRKTTSLKSTEDFKSRVSGRIFAIFLGTFDARTLQDQLEQADIPIQSVQKGERSTRIVGGSEEYFFKLKVSPRRLAYEIISLSENIEDTRIYRFIKQGRYL